MNIQVCYKSKGNTKKMAKAIGRALEVVPKELSEVLPTTETEVLFLGCGIYGGDVAPQVKEFIEKLDPISIGRIVLFSTSGSGEDQLPNLKELIRGRGMVLEEETLCVKGRAFFFMNRQFPSKHELEAAAVFAKKQVSKTIPQ